MLFPSLKPKSNFQALFYITLALLIALAIYTFGIIWNRAVEREKKVETDENLARMEQENTKLSKSIESLKLQVNSLKEKAAHQAVKVKDKERGIYLMVDGKEIDNPELNEIIHITLERYKHSNEEERKKWIMEGKKREDDYLMNHKW